MSSSGVGINSDVMIKYSELKRERASRYIICTIKNGEIVVDRTGNHDATYEDMLANLSPEYPAYAIVDLEGLIEGYPARRILLLHWMPEESRIKDKMLYSSSRNTLERSILGEVAYEAGNSEEASLMSVSEKLLTGEIK